MSHHDVMLGLFVAGVPLFLLAFVRTIRRGRSGRPGVLRLVAGNLLLLAALLSAALTGGEVYYRFFVDSTDGYDLDLVTSRWIERHYARNRAGFRDDVEYAATRLAPHRLTILGDSYTNGHGLVDVADRFANRLRAANPDREVRLIADDGWDTGRILEELQRALATGETLDRVLYAYCLNDISDLIPEWQQAARRIYNERPAYPFRNSYLLNTWYYRFRVAYDDSLSGYFDRIAEAYRGAPWPRQRERLDALADLVAGHGGRLAVVTFPFFEKMDDPAYRAIHATLDAFWRERGVPHRDLLEIYEGRPADHWIVSRRDTHPNAEAHRRAAEAIEALLAEPGTDEGQPPEADTAASSR